MLPGHTFISRRTHNRDGQSQAKEHESQSCRCLSLVVVSNALLFVKKKITFPSPICETDGYLIQTTKLVGTTRTITASLRNPSAAEGYYDVLCGTPMKEVAKALEKEGRALINMGGCSGSSLTSFPSAVIP